MTAMLEPVVVRINSYIVFAAATLLFFLVLLFRRQRVPKGLELPPGPPGNLLIGNVMPTHHPWETYSRWAKEYGDLVHIQVFGQSMVFVNSMDMARELFDKRSSLYSDRFQSTMWKLVGFDWSVASMEYGQRWRQHRRTFYQYFNSNTVSECRDIQIKRTLWASSIFISIYNEYISRDMIRKFHESPDEFSTHIRNHAGAIILEVVYGIQALPTGDPYIDMAEKAMASVAEVGNAGSFLVDMLPILKYVPSWMPGASFQRKALVWRKTVTDMVELPFMAAKRALGTGTARPSMIASLLEDLHNSYNVPHSQEEVIRNVGAVAYAAGSDTVVSALTSFVLAMVLYPEVQKQGQSEVDRVVGMDRLPTFEDRERLPYVNAVCNEVLRWQPVAPLALPHRVMEDDVYGRYFIPQGSVVIGNAWAMLQDEKTYGPHPDQFRPERFLVADVPHPTVAFGFGRRTCPGRYLAEDSLFIAISYILKVFNIIQSKDKSGNLIPITNSYTSGTISHPEPFQCSIIARSASMEKLILGRTDS